MSGDKNHWSGVRINDFIEEKMSEFDSIAFPIVKRIFSKTIGGEPEGPEPTGFKLLTEMYEPPASLVSVQPMQMPTGLVFYMDYKYNREKQNKENELNR